MATAAVTLDSSTKVIASVPLTFALINCNEFLVLNCQNKFGSFLISFITFLKCVFSSNIKRYLFLIYQILFSITTFPNLYLSYRLENCFQGDILVFHKILLSLFFPKCLLQIFSKQILSRIFWYLTWEASTRFYCYLNRVLHIILPYAFPAYIRHCNLF